MLLLSQTYAIARRILLEQWRQRRGLVFWAVFPAGMMLLFGLIYAQDSAMRVNFDALPGAILIGGALFFSGLGGTMSIVVGERERGTLRRLQSTPLRPAAYFLGVVTALAVVALGQAVVVFGVSHALGARYQGSVALGALIVVLSMATYVGLGFVFGARFVHRTEDVPGPLSAFGVPLLVLAGTFFPLELMPGFLRTLARADPVLYMNQAMKAVAGHGAGMAELSTELAVMAGCAALSLAAGVAAWRRLLADEPGS